MKRQVFLELGLNSFISLEEFMSAKPPCRNCLVKMMCIANGRIIDYFGPKLKLKRNNTAIRFRDICDETENFLKKHRVKTNRWP